MSRQTFRCRLSTTVTDYNRDYVFSSLVQRFTGFNPQISVPQGNLFTLTVDTNGHLTPSVIKEKLIHSSFVESVSMGDTKKQVMKMPQMQAVKKADFIKESPDWAHGEGFNGTPLTDTASNNPQTEEQGVSGVNEKGMTGEGQMSYTIGDHIASSDKNNSFDVQGLSADSEHPKQEHYDFLRENAKRFYDAGGTIEIHRVGAKPNLACAKELRDQADRLEELNISIGSGLSQKPDRPLARLSDGLNTVIGNVRSLAANHMSGHSEPLTTPDVFIFARDKDKNIVGSIRARNIIDSEGLEALFQSRMEQYHRGLEDYTERARVHKVTMETLHRLNPIQDEWSTPDVNFNSTSYPFDPPRKPTRENMGPESPDVGINGLGSTGQVVGTGSALQHALVHHILQHTGQNLQSSHTTDAAKFHMAIGRRVYNGSSSWTPSDVLKIVENTKIPNEKVTIKD